MYFADMCLASSLTLASNDFYARSTAVLSIVHVFGYFIYSLDHGFLCVLVLIMRGRGMSRIRSCLRHTRQQDSGIHCQLATTGARALGFDNSASPQVRNPATPQPPLRHSCSACLSGNAVCAPAYTAFLGMFPCLAVCLLTIRENRGYHCSRAVKGNSQKRLCLPMLETKT